MSFLQEIKKGCFYIVQKVKVGGQWQKKLIRRATEKEIETYRIAKSQIKDMALITCANPDCDKQIMIPRSQKRELNTTYPLRYNRFNLVYCSEECQQEHERALHRDGAG